MRKHTSLWTNKSRKKSFISIFAIFFSAIVVSVMTALYVLLVRQIELMNTDNASFQSLYTADSLFECLVYKEQTATGTNSIFYPANASTLGNCGVNGDLSFSSTPVIVSGRSSSTVKFLFTTPSGDFCGIANVGKQVDNSEIASIMYITGQSKNCSDSATRVVERLIEFYF